jgi:hypothetical protein
VSVLDGRMIRTREVLISLESTAWTTEVQMMLEGFFEKWICYRTNSLQLANLPWLNAKLVNIPE